MELQKFPYFKISFHSKTFFPSPFIGVEIWKAIEANLKRIVCLRGNRKCEECPFQPECLYFQWFKKRESVPCRLTFPITGEISFELNLVGDFCRGVSYFLSALLEVERKGLKGGKVKLEGVKIEVNKTLFYQNGEIVGEIPSPLQFDPVNFSTPSRVIEIRYLSPIRLRNGERPTYLPLVRELYRHYLEFFPPQENEDFPSFSHSHQFPALFKTSYGVGRWGGGWEYLEGEMGFLRVEGVDKIGYQLLKMGEILGVGEWREIGFGNYQVGKGGE